MRVTRKSVIVVPLLTSVTASAGQRCADGDPACDADAKVNGACTFSGALVPLRASLRGLKPRGVRLAGRKGRATCVPARGPPRFSDQIEPVLAARCATPACHTAASTNVAPVLRSAGGPPPRCSERRQGAVIVTVPAVRMMQVSRDEVITVLGVRDGLVAAARAVSVGLVVPFAGVRGRAGRRVRRPRRDGALVDMISVRVVHMAVMEVVSVIPMSDRGVSATGPVGMIVLSVGAVLLHASPSLQSSSTLARKYGRRDSCSQDLREEKAGEDPSSR
jgi:hypothetical protein